MLTDLPSGPGWDFGGFPYGLEPLTLPAAGAHDPPARPAVAPERYGDACRRIQRIGRRGIAEGEIARCESADGLFWFRWVVGHQVSFIVWRLTALLLDEVARGGLQWPAVLGPLRHYVRGYTAMLLYTGSCPPGTYQRLIRPSMRLQHPAFSGSWAPDYWPVRDLLRNRRLPFAHSPEAAELVHAIRLMQLVHDGVAAKLVPDGRSLLRQSTVRRQDMRLLHVMYDNYFMTLRAPVSRHDVVAQLLRRLVAIASDLAANELHPALPAGDGAPPEELWVADVLACEAGLVEILAQLAICAAGLSEDCAGEEALGDDGRTRGRVRPAAGEDARDVRSPGGMRLTFAGC